MAGEIKGWLPGIPIIQAHDYCDSPYFRAVHYIQQVERKSTPFCEMEINYNPLFGHMLFINGEIQISEADYRNYHAAMWTAGKRPTIDWPQRVLVIGDGDGGFTRLLDGRIVDVVERDQAVIDAGKQYFGADWGRMHLHQKSLENFEPGWQYDAIMLAIDDGFNTDAALENDLDRIVSWLKPGGKIVAQAGTDLDPKHPKIFERYWRWGEKQRLRCTKAREFIACYFCHVNFFVAEK